MIKTATRPAVFCRSVERGQSMVEFALLLLPFLFATIAIIEIGRAWSVKQSVTNAAREGTRILMLPYGINRSCPDIDCSSATGLQAASVEAIRFYLSSAGISPDEPLTHIDFVRQTLNNDGSITTEPLSGEMLTGDRVGVKITHEYTSLMQGFFTPDNSTISLAGASVMRHE